MHLVAGDAVVIGAVEPHDQQQYGEQVQVELSQKLQEGCCSQLGQTERDCQSYHYWVGSGNYSQALAHADQLVGGVDHKVGHHGELQVWLVCGLVREVGRLEVEVFVRFVGKD